MSFFHKLLQYMGVSESGPLNPLILMILSISLPKSSALAHFQWQAPSESPILRPNDITPIPKDVLLPDFLGRSSHIFGDRRFHGFFSEMNPLIPPFPPMFVEVLYQPYHILLPSFFCLTCDASIR